MSRHVWTDVEKKHSVVVGHDRPLQHFFLQIEDLTADEDDEQARWIVLSWDGMPLDEIVAYLQEYDYKTPIDVAAVLKADQACEQLSGRSLNPRHYNIQEN